MRYLLIAIQDKATESFGRPFVARSENEAIRTIEKEVNRAAEDNMLYTHPSDYAVYKCGMWDDESGNVFPLDNALPMRIVECNSLKKQ